MSGPAKHEEPKAPQATPAHQPARAPAPPPSGEPVRRMGAEVEAVTTRVGANPGHELVRGALDTLMQRTVDRLPDDQKEGSKQEFESYRQQVEAIIGKPE